MHNFEIDVSGKFKSCSERGINIRQISVYTTAQKYLSTLFFLKRGTYFRTLKKKVIFGRFF